MSIPMDFVLNVCWAALWCLFLLIEIIVSFLRETESTEMSI